MKQKRFIHFFLLLTFALVLFASVNFLSYKKGLIKEYDESNIVSNRPEFKTDEFSRSLTTTTPIDEGRISVGDRGSWLRYTNTTEGYTVQFPKNIYKRKPCIGEELLLVSENSEMLTEYSECGRGSPYTVEFRTFKTGETIPGDFIETTNTLNPGYLDLVSKYTNTIKNVYILSGLSITDYVQTKIEPINPPGTDFLDYIKTHQNELGFYEYLPSWKREVYIKGSSITTVVLFFDKPNNDVLDQILSTFKFLITKEEAIQKVLALDEVKDYIKSVPSSHVDIDQPKPENGKWTVHVYEIVGNHTATFNWYYVDQTSGKVSNEFNN